ncbi:MAG: glycosyltransferase family 2 protein [Bacteroidetes bacterium]|nr:MAG: glycosyltransferase family 2 protein [Bacteroidota bacterium]
MKKITVSVLTSVYNTDFGLVKRALDSVLNQDFQDFELILIDDGSDNDSETQLLAYARTHEDKITYLRHANRGQANSINRGVINSVGRYITILDADDEYKPGHLSLCLEEMQHADLIASTTETVVDSDENYYVPDKQDPSRMVHVDECILFATLFGKREVFENIGFQQQYGADVHFFELASQTYRTRKVDLRSYIYYRNIPTSICSTLKREQLTVSA